MATRTRTRIDFRSGQRLTPFLWFDHQAEQAARFYCSIFKRSKVQRIGRYSDAGPGKPGAVMTVAFQLEGQDFVALNGGPVFQHSPAISFVVNCKSQREVDTYWRKLLRGGKPSQCGWLTDRFGVSWQVVPAELVDLMVDLDPRVASAVSAVVLRMVKLDLAAARKAAAAARKEKRA